MKKRKILAFFLVLGCHIMVHGQVKIILDTDMGPDYDDVGALAMVHALVDKGEADLLATMACTNYEGVAKVLEIINTYFGRPQIPIGVARDYGVNLRDWQFWSDTLISRYPHSFKTNNDARDAVDLYRDILSKQEDESVTIVTIGFLSNIAALLKSGPDRHSPLSGHELVSKKVKSLVSMAGKFPEGMEFNIEEDAEAGIYTFSNWPNQLIFSGFEIGEKIKTGIPLIQNQSIINSPIKDVFRISIPMADEDKYGRMSWDQTAVLVAVRGADPYYDLAKGQIILQPNGYNSWNYQSGDHFHLKEKMPAKEVEKLINELMMYQPSR